MIQKISIVIPALNEARRIVPTLRKIHAYLGEKAEDFEIIVVDDGSTDDTSDLVERESQDLTEIKVLRNGVNQGKGFSVRHGVLESRFPLVLMTDADLSTPIEEVENLLSRLEQGYDVVIGSRALAESKILIHQPWYREFMGQTFNKIVQVLLLKGFKDTQCGFKLFRTDKAKELFTRSRIKGFAFDVEILLLAAKWGFRITEVPVKWVNSPDSRVGIVTAPVKMFLDLFKIRIGLIFGTYKRDPAN